MGLWATAITLRGGKAMARIIAEGTLGSSETIRVIYSSEGEFTVDGFPDEVLQERLELMIEEPPAIGGTYYPEPGTMLAVLASLKGGFFDGGPVKVAVEGDIGTIPNEGKIY